MTKLLTLLAMTLALLGVVPSEARAGGNWLGCDVVGSANGQTDNQRMILGPFGTDGPIFNFPITGQQTPSGEQIFGGGSFNAGPGVTQPLKLHFIRRHGAFMRNYSGSCPPSLTGCSGDVLDFGTTGNFGAPWTFAIPQPCTQVLDP